jgi:hypothetical protein
MRLASILLCACVAFFVAGVGATPAARAQSKPDYEKAKQHYIRATAALEQGDNTIAAREFGLAYEITKDPILFYKIALANERAGNCDAALVYYGRYLREARPGAAERADTERRIAACEAKVASEAAAAGAGATDAAGSTTGAAGAATGGAAGGAAGTGGDTAQPVGGADAPDTAPADGATAAGDAAAGGAAFDEGAEPPPTFVDEPVSWQRTMGWVSVGVALAAATTAGVLGLSASSREEDVDTLIDFRDPVTGEPRTFDGQVRTQYEEYVEEGEDLESYSRIAWGVAGAAAASAVVFFVIDAVAGSDAPAERSAGARPRVQPVVTAGGGGLVAGWVF